MTRRRPTKVIHRQTPPTSEDLTRRDIEGDNAGDAYPTGERTGSREALQATFVGLVQQTPRRLPEAPLTTLIAGDLALTSTPAAGGGGVRAQVARRQPDGF